MSFPVSRVPLEDSLRGGRKKTGPKEGKHDAGSLKRFISHQVWFAKSLKQHGGQEVTHKKEAGVPPDSLNSWTSKTPLNKTENRSYLPKGLAGGAVPCIPARGRLVEKRRHATVPRPSLRPSPSPAA